MILAEQFAAASDEDLLRSAEQEVACPPPHLPS